MAVVMKQNDVGALRDGEVSLDPTLRVALFNFKACAGAGEWYVKTIRAKFSWWRRVDRYLLLRHIGDYNFAAVDVVALDQDKGTVTAVDRECLLSFLVGYVAGRRGKVGK